jgi:hypothetical protein
MSGTYKHLKDACPLFRRTAASAEGGEQTGGFGNTEGPMWIAEWGLTIDALTYVFELLVTERLIQPGIEFGRRRDGPAVTQVGLPETRPWPLHMGAGRALPGPDFAARNVQR